MKAAGQPKKIGIVIIVVVHSAMPYRAPGPWLWSCCRRAILFVGSAHDDLQRIIRHGRCNALA